MTGTGKRVGILNPLPQALRHYVDELDALLTAGGVEVVRLSAVDIEVGGSSRQRASALVAGLKERAFARSLPDVDALIVTWPAFGYLDFALWRPRRSTPITIVIHDPAPLRRQFGLTRGWSRTVAHLPAVRPTTLVHSPAAAAELRAREWPVDAVLPLPMARPAPHWRPGLDVVVLGQYKDARDLALLEGIGEELVRRGLPGRILGRGWPHVPGWDVTSEFLSESDFDARITTARCILLPYSRIFQSDVAVRAAERAVPVVGPEASNIPDLFGPAWPGSVPAGASAREWVAAIDAVTGLAPTDVEATVDSAYGTARAAWARWADALHGQSASTGGVTPDTNPGSEVGSDSESGHEP